MSSRHLIDPDLLPIIDAVPTVDFSAELLPLIRAGGLPLQAQAPDLEQVQLLRRIVPGPAGAPPVEVALYRPASQSATLPCVLHIHGGGYVTGKTASMEPIHRSVAQAAQCCIVTVEYRLAPETPFPGALEDCYAALAWLHASASQLHIDPCRIGVMGESAGGGLAAALALLARDRGELPLEFQHLIYPMLDDRTCVSPQPHPYAAAARAQDLSGLPPTFISTGALDLFIEEDIEYARRLLRAGVPVELHVYPGAFHGFEFLSDCTVSSAARRDSLAALRRFMRV